MFEKPDYSRKVKFFAKDGTPLNVNESNLNFTIDEDRPAEVELLLGDASKAKKVIEWESKTNIDELIKIMVDYDLKHNDYGFD